MNKKKNFLTAKQVSEYLCIPLRTVQYFSKQQKIKSYKFGRQWRYPKTEIERYGSKYNIGEKSNFLTTKQVSEYLSIHLRTIRRLSKYGKIKSFKIGRQWRYLKKDIEKYSLNNKDFSKDPVPSKTWDGLTPEKPARKSNDFTERRAYPRINCSLPCYIKVEIPRKKEIYAQSRIINISEGGLFLENCDNEETFVAIKNDDPVNLSLTLDGENKLKADGRVLRCTTVGGTQDKGIAVKFKRLHQNTRELIKEYVG